MKTQKLISTLLTASMLLSLGTGCSAKPSKKPAKKPQAPTIFIERPSGQTPIFELCSTSGKSVSQNEMKKNYSEFVMKLLNECAKDRSENILVSPDSVLLAMGMTAAGANGETLNQMMQTLVPNATNEDGFRFAADRMKHLDGEQLQVANSIWIADRKAADFYADYTNYVQRHFEAEVFNFDPVKDGATPINEWTSEKTSDRIPKILEELDPLTACVLVNAIVFDGTWEKNYEDDAVLQGDFTKLNGETQSVMFLNSHESLYVQNDSACGFIKPYDGGDFAFMTILPDDESISINDYVANMTSEDYWNLWESQMDAEVISVFPEFTCDYGTSLVPYLMDMGMVLPFDEVQADFSNMVVDNDIYITDVVHKTFIKVDRFGTEAAAATAVVMTDKACEIPDKTAEVICDRPFAYAIVDMQTGLPVFFGTVNDVNSPT